MGEQAKPSGPDLTRGVPVTSVKRGGSVVGQVDGEAVLLVRQEDEWLAIGATCSHYNGPLGEGLIVGETVRCPWHHACFSLRTGEALRPPALHPVTCYRVEVSGETVRVTGKVERKAAPAARKNAPASVVIVGGGAAGDSAAATLRHEGYGGPITIVDPDADAPYDRPNCSKDYLAGNAPEDWLPLRSPEWDRDNGIDRLRGRRVATLRPGERRVELDDGSTRDYGALLLATGATPARLGPEVDRGGMPVHYLRSLRDSRAIIAAAREGGRAVVIGSSFIGLEVAASLRARKMEVDVVGPDTRPLERVLGPTLGDFIRGLHEEHGVRFHLERKPAEITGGAVTLDRGERLAADLVVVGIGVRPNVELAQSAGLAVDRGVSVNERLETSAPSIYAAGDIARWPDPLTGERIRVEHWVVAQRQGQAAAQNILGLQRRFDAVPFFWSQHYDVAINYVGHAERWDVVDVDGDPSAHDCSVWFRRGDRTYAVATIFRDKESLETEAAMERGREALGEAATRH
ncbi:MAG TPA: FAD-dependent oxidoreductase [Gemmatimonadales bacterium]|nr:FAD-dependent oxidoreductase [Gemmatimonadales bacterium]